MKAAIVSAPEAIPAFADHPEPPPDPRNGVLTMVAAALHPVVRSLATGRHYASRDGWPLVPGVDGVARTTEGSLVYVAATRPPYGTFAEQVSPSLAIPLPDGADPVLIAAGTNPAMSSWLPLKARRRELGADGLGTVLVLGASGVAGRIAVQNAFALGADHVLAAGRDAAALEDLSGPARSLVRLTGVADQDQDLLAAAMAEHHPSTVVDYVWGAPAEAAFAALARVGFTPDDAPVVYLQVGEAAGADAALPAALLRSTAISIWGSGAGAASMQEILADIPEVMARLAHASEQVPITTYPLDEVATAWQAPRSEGRVVLTPPAG